jgi:hypothetical protein
LLLFQCFIELRIQRFRIEIGLAGGGSFFIAFGRGRFHLREPQQRQFVLTILLARLRDN